MGYQVITRKYRPQYFSEVIGQEHVTRTLQNAISAKRLHHAYLFTGTRGVGKTTVARILAKALNCEKGPAQEPCGKCASCIDISEGKDLDVFEIDGASNTSVDDVREMREHLRYLPSRGRYKIYIIDEVHMLSTAAFNALLKTLEEPPPHVVFILATTEPTKIPPTVLSRCQRYDFRRIQPPLIMDALQKIAKEEGVSIDEDALFVIAVEADGSMRDAESLLDQAVAFAGNKITYDAIKEMIGFADRSKLRELVKHIIEGNTQGALSIVSEVYESGGNLVRLVEDMAVWLHEILVYKISADENSIIHIPSEDRAFIQEVSKLAGKPKLEQMFELCYEGLEKVGRTKYQKMFVELLVSELSGVEERERLDELIAKVESAISLLNGSPATGDLSVKEKAPSKKETSKKGESVNIASPSHTGFRDERREDINYIKRQTIDITKWKSFMEWLGKEKPQLFSILEHGVFDGSRDGSIKLKFTSGSVYIDMLKDAERMKQFRELTQRCFGTPYNVEVLELDSPRLGIDEERERAKRREKELREEAVSHEVIRSAASILGADIKEIRIGEKLGSLDERE